MKPARRRLTAWIAIFAVLLAALAPGIARALSSPQQSLPWSDICTAAGARSIGDLTPQPVSGQHEGTGLAHCPFCLNHGGHFALPPAPPAGLPAIDAGADFLPPQASTPPRVCIRVAAQPRAPPAIS